MNYYKQANIKTLNLFDKLIKNNLDKNSKVLDIGFGTGKFLYRLFHLHEIKYLQGVEYSNIEEIENSKSLYQQLIVKDELYNFLEDFDSKNSQKFHFSAYNYYQKYVQLELNKDFLSQENYKETFSLKYQEPFDKNHFNLSQFDLIIASKLIHYHEIGEPKIFIEDCLELLKTNGIIYISFPLNTGRRKINKDEFKEIINQISNLQMLDELVEIKENSNSSNIIFIGKKA